MKGALLWLLRVTVSMATVITSSQAQAWQEVEAPPVRTPATTTIGERGGAVLQIEGDAVVRRIGDRAQPLVATFGRMAHPWALVASRGGATFAVASNGVFVTHPDVDSIDRCEFLDANDVDCVGVVCDRIDRLWVATRTRLLVVHPGLGFQREHGAAEGLPPAPFLGLEVTADGQLLLWHAGGVHGFRPDPATPVAPELEVRPGSHGSCVRFEFAAQAVEGVTFRYRERSHHLLRATDGEVDLRRPGRHELLVHALDAELDLSPPTPVVVDLPFPAGLDARHVAGLGLGLGLVGVAWLWISARRRGLGVRRAALDSILVLVVALQVAMAMTGIGRTWPFIGFTMYREVYRENDVLYTPELVARTASGTRLEHGGSLAFATDGIWRHLASLLYAEAPARRRAMDLLPRDVEALELRIRRCRLTAEGPRDIAPFVLAVLPRGGR